MNKIPVRKQIKVTRTLVRNKVHGGHPPGTINKMFIKYIYEY